MHALTRDWSMRETQTGPDVLRDEVRSTRRSCIGEAAVSVAMAREAGIRTVWVRSMPNEPIHRAAKGGNRLTTIPAMTSDQVVYRIERPFAGPEPGEQAVHERQRMFGAVTGSGSRPQYRKHGHRTIGTRSVRSFGHSSPVSVRYRFRNAPGHRGGTIGAVSASRTERRRVRRPRRRPSAGHP